MAMLTVEQLNSWYTPKNTMENQRTTYDAIEDELEDKECEHCNGTGIVDAVVAVYPGEPHMAHVGSQQCICQMGDEDDWREED